MKYWSNVVRITRMDQAKAWGALSATATFYCATCIVLYTHHCETLIVINQCISPMLLMSLYITLPEHYHGCKPSCRMDKNVSNSKKETFKVTGNGAIW